MSPTIHPPSSECERLCKCPVCSKRRDEDNAMWYAGLKKLPEAGNTQSGHGDEAWSEWQGEIEKQKA